MINIDLFGNVIIEDQEEEMVKSKPSPFDYVKSISNKTSSPDIEEYNSYIVNLAFSQRSDTIHYSNEMNFYHHLDDQLQYDFYYYAMPKKNYFAKWAKSEKSEITHIVAEYFNVSYKVAKQYEKVLQKEHIKKIKNWHSNKKGGKT